MAFPAIRARQPNAQRPAEEALLARVADAVPVAFLFLDARRKVVSCGGGGAAALGISVADAPGLPVERFFPNAPTVMHAIEQAYSGSFSEQHFERGGIGRTVRAFPVPEGRPSDNVLLVVFDTAARDEVDRDFPVQRTDAGTDGVIVAGDDGRILSVSPRAAHVLRVDGDGLLGRPVSSVLTGVDTSDMTSSGTREVAFTRGDGSVIPLAVSMETMALDGRCVVLILVSEEVERVALKRALADSEARYELIAAGANDGLWEWNIEDGTVQFSPRWRTLLGLESESIKCTPEDWLSRIHPDDVQGFCDRFDAHLDGETPQFEHEYRMFHANGEFRWVQARGMAARRENGEPFLMAGSQADITDRKLAEESLTHGALHDALTGLPNRALMLDRVNQAVARLNRSDDQRFALVVLDLDRFIIVNESLGHAAGDELLVSLARRLEAKVAQGDTLSRLGGDEFAVLMEQFESLDQVRDAIKDMQNVISQPFFMNGKEIFVSASIGVAVGHTGYQRAEEVLRDADLAMYRSKKEGKAGYEFFDESRHRGSVDLLQVESSLRRALENNDILVQYQPIVDLKRGIVTGFEALARMSDPVRGVVPPGEFIGVAEETGLIVPLGERVLELACKTASDWQHRFGLENGLSMSVNLSARHLAEEGIVELLEDVLARSSLPPRDLKIEITESLIMTNPELAAQTLARIKDLGVTLSLDDFGTGYSSLSYLRRFPIDTLKMDRSFVGRMDTDERDMELVRMIIMLAHTLGMEVIGEGIESESQVGLLRDLDCEFGQGYFFARPLSEDAVVDLLANKPSWR